MTAIKIYKKLSDMILGVQSDNGELGNNKQLLILITVTHRFFNIDWVFWKVFFVEKTQSQLVVFFNKYEWFIVVM